MSPYNHDGTFFLLCVKYWVLRSTFNFFVGSIFNDFQSSTESFNWFWSTYTSKFKILLLVILVMSYILWKFSHIIKTVDPYLESTKIKVKQKSVEKKNPFPRKIWKTIIRSFFVDFLNVVRHTVIRISIVLIVFELWHFFDFSEYFCEILWPKNDQVIYI